VASVEVELIEDGEDDPSSPGAPGRGTSTGRSDERTDEHATRSSRGRHTGRWWLVGAAAVLVGGAVVGQHVLDARHEARVSRFDGVPGVLRPLADPPVVGRELPVDVGSSLTQVGSSLLVAEVHEDAGDVRFELVDRGTGETLHRASVELPDTLVAQARRLASAPVVACRPLGTVHAACVAGPSGLVLEDDPVPDLLVVLDTTTGEVVDRRDVVEETWTTSGDTVVVATAERTSGTPPVQHTWTLTATTATGEVAWAWTAAEPVVTADGLAMVGASLDADSSRVLLAGTEHWWLLDPSGTLLREGEAPVSTWTGLGRSGTLLQATYSDSDGPVTRLYPAAPDVRTGIEVPGSPGGLTVDDGSAAGVALAWADTTEGTTVSALDAGTGRTLWSRVAVGRGAVLLDDTLYVGAADHVLALDARTGATVWDVTTRAYDPLLATDGRSIVVIEEDGWLAALRTDDGAVLWEARPERPGATGSDLGAWIMPYEGVLLYAGDGSEPARILTAGPAAATAAVPRSTPGPRGTS